MSDDESLLSRRVLLPPLILVAVAGAVFWYARLSGEDLAKELLSSILQVLVGVFAVNPICQRDVRQSRTEI